MSEELIPSSRQPDILKRVTMDERLKCADFLERFADSIRQAAGEISGPETDRYALGKGMFLSLYGSEIAAIDTVCKALRSGSYL